MLGTALKPLELIMQSEMLQKQLNIMDNSAHPLHNIEIKQQNVFSQLFSQLCYNKIYYIRPFMPSPIILILAIKMYIHLFIFYTHFI